MKKIKKTAEFLLENGLLFEINRRVMHPLGLALEVEQDDEGKLAIGAIWDCRDEAEGILFSSDTFATGKEKFNKYMANTGSMNVANRERLLGFVEQTDKDQ